MKYDYKHINMKNAYMGNESWKFQTNNKQYSVEVRW